MNTTIIEEAATFYITLNQEEALPGLRLKLFYQASAGGAGVLCVDMSGIAALSKQALETIADFKRVSALKGIELVLVHVHESMQRLIEAAGLKSLKL